MTRLLKKRASSQKLILRMRSKAIKKSQALIKVIKVVYQKLRS
jgi:hypothetical protein